MSPVRGIYTLALFPTRLSPTAGQFVTRSSTDGFSITRRRGLNATSRYVRIRPSTFGFHPLKYTNFQRDVVGGIIYEHSKTLQTLTYLSTVGHIRFQVFEHLPLLRNLTVVCLRYNLVVYGVHNNNPLHRTTQFPSLERLHINLFQYRTPLRA